MYSIPACNMDTLKARLNTISNKCKKYGFECSYKEISQEFREVIAEDNSKFIELFYNIEVTGNVLFQNWKFIATIEHTDKDVNIIRMPNEAVIPKQYHTCNPVCEHCNTTRSRKDTYLIQNTETSEFKQIGKSCLKEYTGGLSAEMVACYLSYFNEVKDNERLPSFSSRTYMNTHEFLCYVAETLKHFGFVATSEQDATAYRAVAYYRFDNKLPVTYKTTDSIRNEMQKFNFKVDYNNPIVDQARNWAISIESDNNYLNNLKAACKQEYVETRDAGILASLFVAYNKQLEIDRLNKEREEKLSIQRASSKHVGNVGERITFNINSFETVSSYEGDYGVVFLHKFIDDKGNILMWSSSVWLDSEKTITKLIGTVKDHNEYQGVAQTYLTRCKVID